MADIHSKAVRSYNMSKIKNKNTKPELIVRQFLHGMGFRYRLHVKNLPGQPDIVLAKYKTAIFIHGCFWHSHKDCKFAATPKSNVEYWEPKLNNNILRDLTNTRTLKKNGWNVIIIWECELKTVKLEKTLKKLLRFIHKY